ncbi:hypothetical protein GOODEAATRI_001556, partial [Goodea atripinnis]
MVGWPCVHLDLSRACGEKTSGAPDRERGCTAAPDADRRNPGGRIQTARTPGATGGGNTGVGFRMRADGQERCRRTHCGR